MKIHGLGESHKGNVIHIVVCTHNVDILCLWEMIVVGNASIGFMADILKG
jgi:hypothetical protein